MLKKIIFIFLGTIAVCWAGCCPHCSDRPCDLKDYKCIAGVLSSYSSCTPVTAPSIPSQYTVPRFRFEEPTFKATYYDNNLLVINHNQCYISEFCINPKTQVAVIGIDCRNFHLESLRTYIQHVSLCEDEYYNFEFKGTYPHIRMTANLNLTSHMSFCDAYVLTEVLELPDYHITPSDKPTEKHLSRDTSDLMLYETVNFFWRGYPIARIFMDRTICNYRCYPRLID